MIYLLFALAFATVSVTATVSIDVQVAVDQTARKYIPTPYYLGVTLDSCFIKYNFCHINWMKAIRLARFLGPGYLRIGGTDADYLTFVPPEKNVANLTKNGQEFQGQDWFFEWTKKPKACSTESMFVHSKFAMTASQLDRVAWFARSSGWRLIFDLNLGKRTPENSWDRKNANQLLSYADRMKYSMDFELGNEMNGYPNPHSLNITVNGTQLVEDYRTLKRLLKQFPTFKNSKLVGPAIGSSTKILKQYYGDGRSAKIQDFLDPKGLDGLVNNFEPVLRMVKKYYPTKPPPVWYGETSSMYHGGAKNLSDRYVAGFLWLDKLGLSAKSGLTGVIRQTFFMGNYALIDPETNPNPDYWLSVLYKMLIGPIVLNATATVAPPVNSSHSFVRFYAHCQRNKDLTIYGLNLLNESAQVVFLNQQPVVHQYLLEPEQGDLTSKNVLLNGKLLWTDGVNFPALHPKIVNQPVILPPTTFAFYVFNNGCYTVV